jgi:PAS domain S-box-containing protein
MLFKDLPIKKKLMRFIALISGAVLFVTCATFFAYELFKFRQNTLQKLSTIGKIISFNGSAALAFANQDDAKEILASLKSEPNIVAACFYDKDGKLFAHYPDSLKINSFPVKPEATGYYFVRSHLEGFEPVIQGTAKLGTLYLKSDLEDLYDRLLFYGVLTIIVIAVSFLLAYLLSAILQKSISKPILALSETAKVISQQKDYSVRAVKLGDDELGLLTDAFNQMLGQIQEQNQTLNEFNKNLAQKVSERTSELEIANNGLKESEEQIQTIFRSAPNALVVMNQEGNIIRWNQQAEEIFGWKAEEIIGKPMSETIMPNRFREMMTNGIKRFLLTGEAPILNQTLELAANRKGGIEFPVEIRISYTKSNDKYVFIAFITNITERKKSEAELKQKSEELMHANKELEQFVYVASHDLQEPLRTISNFAGLFEQDYSDKLDEDTNQYLSFIVKAAARMQNLIKDLLDFSRIGRKITFVNVDCNKILLEIIAEMGSSITESSAKINYSNLPILKGNETELKQLFQNLISNAIKFRKKDVSPVIDISSQEKETEYLFAIKDNGIGFEEEYKDKIFIIFQRLHNAEEYPGTGIGLATCKKIVTQHNGRIWVESKLGEGSTFYFTISKKL